MSPLLLLVIVLLAQRWWCTGTVPTLSSFHGWWCTIAASPVSAPMEVCSVSLQEACLLLLIALHVLNPFISFFFSSSVASTFLVFFAGSHAGGSALLINGFDLSVVSSSLAFNLVSNVGNGGSGMRAGPTGPSLASGGGRLPFLFFLRRTLK